jgi:hypothetical protein
VGLGRLVSGIVGSNPAQGMDVCPLSFCVVLSCVGRGLATADHSSKESYHMSKQLKKPHM